MARQPRQRPVSCHFCRVRKLRCSRVFPCSNCTSRGLPCPEPQDPPPGPSQFAGGTSGTSAAAETDKRTSPGDASDSDILARLERLEALLAVRTRELDAAEEEKKKRRDRQSSPAGLASQLPLPQPMSPKVQNLTQEAMFLERNCLGPKLSVGVSHSCVREKRTHPSPRNPSSETTSSSASVPSGSSPNPPHPTSSKTPPCLHPPSPLSPRGASGCRSARR